MITANTLSDVRHTSSSLSNKSQLVKNQRGEADDWRTMKNEEWAKILKGIDKYIDEYKEDLKLREEKSKEAALKADAFANYVKPIETRYPYSSLEKDGFIEYNGVVFVGDPKSNSINLGDMSDKTKIFRIQLSGGGFLNVNYDNLGDLQYAIGMFSPEDQGIILKALATYKFENGLVTSAEKEEEETIKNLSEEEKFSEEELSEDIHKDAQTALEQLKYNGLSTYESLLRYNEEEIIKVGPSEIKELKSKQA